MLKTTRRELDNRMLPTNNKSYKKLFTFFRSRCCNIIRQNRKLIGLIIIGTIILCLTLYSLNEQQSQSMHYESAHLYVQNPVFFDETISDQRIIKTESHNIDYSSMTDLIIVSGHAVYSHYSYKECTDPSNWRLMQHQKAENHLSAFLEHIATGIDLTYNNPSALLIFSGGSTRTEIKPFSEGSAYWKVAQNCNYSKFKHFESIQSRAFTEDYAMDSFQNILFSICRFYEITGNYPSSITAISWSYKKTRFEKLHRRALDYPKSQFTFLGIDGSVNISDNAWRYEKMAIELFKQDLFGCYAKLKETRIFRNPYFRSLPYPHQCPHLAPLFNICADSEGFEVLNLKLPWN